jgi:hypothetical protein
LDQRRMAVRGGGHQPRPLSRDDGASPYLPFRPMHAIRADRMGQPVVSRDEKQQASPTANHGKVSGEHRSVRGVVVAENHRGSPRQTGSHRNRVGNAPTVGHEYQ